MGTREFRDIVFVTAMECEAECVLAAFDDVREANVSGRRVRYGRAGGVECALIVSGIGKTLAAAAAEFAILALGAKTVLNVGLCGGFGGGVEIGGVYEVDKAAEYDFDISAFNGGLVGVKDGRSSPFVPLVSTGLFPARSLATGDRFNDSDADHRFIGETLGCSLRDMEGAAIAFVCEASGVECRAVKCVSDVADAESMTAQYLENKRLSLDALAAACRDLCHNISACQCK